MKRDMDLVRKIALLIEDHPSGFAPDIVIDGYTEELIGYHIHLMGEAGLLHAADVSHSECASPIAMASSLTWEGHEFVAAARNDTVWNKSKKLIQEKVGTTTIGLLIEVLKQQAKQVLGLA